MRSVSITAILSGPVGRGVPAGAPWAWAAVPIAPQRSPAASASRRPAAARFGEWVFTNIDRFSLSSEARADAELERLELVVLLLLEVERVDEAQRRAEDRQQDAQLEAGGIAQPREV